MNSVNVIASLVEAGFEGIDELESPIIFNIEDPVYFKHGTKYAMVSASTEEKIEWDVRDKGSMQRILLEDERAITNPGPEEEEL